MRWWRRRKGRRKVGYPRVHFDVVGDPLIPRAWASAGRAGPLEWSARLERVPGGVSWSLEVAGTLTGTEKRSGVGVNQYAAVDECKAALRGVIDDHNTFANVARG